MAVNELQIRPLNVGEDIPMSLLLLADPSPEVVNSYIFRGTGFVGEIDGCMVGEYVLLETRPRTVELVNVAVDEQHQGHGLGRQLVTHAIATARSKGYNSIEVGTGNSSVLQLVLYQKCGFRIVGVDKDFFVRHYNEPIYENGMRCQDMIRLALDLG